MWNHQTVVGNNQHILLDSVPEEEGVTSSSATNSFAVIMQQQQHNGSLRSWTTAMTAQQQQPLASPDATPTRSTAQMAAAAPFDLSNSSATITASTGNEIRHHLRPRFVTHSNDGCKTTCSVPATPDMQSHYATPFQHLYNNMPAYIQQQQQHPSASTSSSGSTLCNGMSSSCRTIPDLCSSVSGSNNNMTALSTCGGGNFPPQQRQIAYGGPRYYYYPHNNGEQNEQQHASTAGGFWSSASENAPSNAAFLSPTKSTKSCYAVTGNNNYSNDIMQNDANNNNDAATMQRSFTRSGGGYQVRPVSSLSSVNNISLMNYLHHQQQQQHQAGGGCCDDYANMCMNSNGNMSLITRANNNAINHTHSPAGFSSMHQHHSMAGGDASSYCGYAANDSAATNNIRSVSEVNLIQPQSLQLMFDNRQQLRLNYQNMQQPVLLDNSNNNYININRHRVVDRSASAASQPTSSKSATLLHHQPPKRSKLYNFFARGPLKSTSALLRRIKSTSRLESSNSNYNGNTLTTSVHEIDDDFGCATPSASGVDVDAANCYSPPLATTPGMAQNDELFVTRSSAAAVGDGGSGHNHQLSTENLNNNADSALQRLALQQSSDTFVMPMHPSVAGDDKCFSVFTKTSQYGLRCSNESEREFWVKKLSSIICLRENLSFRVHHACTIWLQECKGLPAGGATSKSGNKQRHESSSYHCELYLDDSLYARTQAKQKQQSTNDSCNDAAAQQHHCFWGEVFEFDHVRESHMLQIRLLNKKLAPKTSGKNSVSGSIKSVSSSSSGRPSKQLLKLKKSSNKTVSSSTGAVDKQHTDGHFMQFGQLNQPLMALLHATGSSNMHCTGRVTLPISDLAEKRIWEGWFPVVLEEQQQQPSNNNRGSRKQREHLEHGGFESRASLTSSSNVSSTEHSSSTTTTPAACSKDGTVVALRMKIKYQLVHILPLHCYDRFLSGVRLHYVQLCSFLDTRVGVKAKEEVAVALVRIMHSCGLAEQYVADVIMDEVNALNDDHLVFRGNSLATKSIEHFMKLIGRNYLQETLGALLRSFADCSSDDDGGVSFFGLSSGNNNNNGNNAGGNIRGDCEVDPTKLTSKHSTSSQVIKKHQANLIACVEKVYYRIINSHVYLPAQLTKVFCLLRERLEAAGKAELANTLISACIFLRFLCPAILNPHLFGLLPGYASPAVVRKLTLTAKTIQTLANFSRFAGKENYMQCMNAFVEREQDSIRTFLMQISTSIPHELNFGADESLTLVIDQGRELSLLQTLLNEHMPSADAVPAHFAGVKQIYSAVINLNPAHYDAAASASGNVSETENNNNNNSRNNNNDKRQPVYMRPTIASLNAQRSGTVSAGDAVKVQMRRQQQQQHALSQQQNKLQNHQVNNNHDRINSASQRKRAAWSLQTADDYVAESVIDRAYSPAFVVGSSNNNVNLGASINSSAGEGVGYAGGDGDCVQNCQPLHAYNNSNNENNNFAKHQIVTNNNNNDTNDYATPIQQLSSEPRRRVASSAATNAAVGVLPNGNTIASLSSSSGASSSSQLLHAQSHQVEIKPFASSALHQPRAAGAYSQQPHYRQAAGNTNREFYSPRLLYNNSSSATNAPQQQYSTSDVASKLQQQRQVPLPPQRSSSSRSSQASSHKSSGYQSFGQPAQQQQQQQHAVNNQHLNISLAPTRAINNIPVHHQHNQQQVAFQAPLTPATQHHARHQQRVPAPAVVAAAAAPVNAKSAAGASLAGSSDSSSSYSHQYRAHNSSHGRHQQRHGSNASAPVCSASKTTLLDYHQHKLSAPLLSGSVHDARHHQARRLSATSTDSSAASPMSTPPSARRIAINNNSNNNNNNNRAMHALAVSPQIPNEANSISGPLVVRHQMAPFVCERQPRIVTKQPQNFANNNNNFRGRAAIVSKRTGGGGGGASIDSVSSPVRAVQRAASCAAPRATRANYNFAAMPRHYEHDTSLAPERSQNNNTNAVARHASFSYNVDDNRFALAKHDQQPEIVGIGSAAAPVPPTPRQSSYMGDLTRETDLVGENNHIMTTSSSVQRPLVLLNRGNDGDDRHRPFGWTGMAGAGSSSDSLPTDHRTLRSGGGGGGSSSSSSPSTSASALMMQSMSDVSSAHDSQYASELDQLRNQLARMELKLVEAENEIVSSKADNSVTNAQLDDWQRTLYMHDEFLKHKQHEAEHRYSSIVGRLSSLELELRREQSSTQSLLLTKQHVIEEQERRIRELDAQNTRLVAALDGVRDRLRASRVGAVIPPIVAAATGSMQQHRQHYNSSVNTNAHYEPSAHRLGGGVAAARFQPFSSTSNINNNKSIDGGDLTPTASGGVSVLPLHSSNNSGQILTAEEKASSAFFC